MTTTNLVLAGVHTPVLVTLNSIAVKYSSPLAIPPETNYYVRQHSQTVGLKTHVHIHRSFP